MIEHTAGVSAARRTLADTEATPRNYEEACLMRHRLRAALERVLGNNDELLAIVRQRVDDIEAMDRYRAAMETVGRP